MAALMSLCIRYGQDVENYLEVYLRTPGLAKEDITKALLARGNARKRGGEKLLTKAREGISKIFTPCPNPTLWDRFPGCVEAGSFK